MKSRHLSWFLVLGHVFVLTFKLPRWHSCWPTSSKGLFFSWYHQIFKHKTWSGGGQRSTEKCPANQCPFGLPLTLVFIVFNIFIKIFWAECLFYVSEQGNAYITCMPGPVRRWNYPVPLCLGNVWIYGHCLYFRQRANCVRSETVRQLCSSTHSSFVSFALKLFISC